MRCRRWTPEETNELHTLWGHKSIEEIAQALGRTPMSIYSRAREKEGLQLGCPIGFEYLFHAQLRTGFAHPTLLRILRAAGVEIRATMSDPRKYKHVHRFVEPRAVDKAVKLWMASETLYAAAKIRGIGRTILLRTLVTYGRGVPKKPVRKAWRIPTKVIDAAVRASGHGTSTEARAA